MAVRLTAEGRLAVKALTQALQVFEQDTDSAGDVDHTARTSRQQGLTAHTAARAGAPRGVEKTRRQPRALRYRTLGEEVSKSALRTSPAPTGAIRNRVIGPSGAPGTPTRRIRKTGARLTSKARLLGQPNAT